MNIELLDLVVLTCDLPEYNLNLGQAGTVVEILADGEAYEVEFSAPDGRTRESVALRSDQFIVRPHRLVRSKSTPAAR